MHWIKLGFEALKHAWKSFPLLMRTGAWGQHLLALGLETADTATFSMTLA